MSEPSYIMQFYRTEPGDTNANDMFTLDESFESALEILGEELQTHHNNHSVPLGKRPHSARLLAVDGTVLAKIRHTPGDIIERVTFMPDYRVQLSKKGSTTKNLFVPIQTVNFKAENDDSAKEYSRELCDAPPFVGIARVFLLNSVGKIISSGEPKYK